RNGLGLLGNDLVNCLAVLRHRYFGAAPYFIAANGRCEFAPILAVGNVRNKAVAHDGTRLIAGESAVCDKRNGYLLIGKAECSRVLHILDHLLVKPSLRLKGTPVRFGDLRIRHIALVVEGACKNLTRETGVS